MLTFDNLVKISVLALDLFFKLKNCACKMIMNNFSLCSGTQE